MSKLILPSRKLIRPSRRAFIHGAAAVLAMPYIARGQLSQTGAGKKAAGGAGPWTPASVTTSFWYDFTDSSTIFKDAGTTLAVAGTDTIQQANDKSGNSRHLSQATAANRPAYQASIINSLNAAYFADTGTASTCDLMTTTSFAVSQPFLIMFVFRRGGVAIEQFPILFQDGASGVFFFANRNDDALHPIIYAGAPALPPFLRDPAITSMPVNTNFWWYGVFNGASSATRTNFSSGGTELTGNAGTANIATGIQIGSIAALANAIDIKICECFCIPSATGTDKSNAISYVQSKYAL